MGQKHNPTSSQHQHTGSRRRLINKPQVNGVGGWRVVGVYRCQKVGNGYGSLPSDYRTILFIEVTTHHHGWPTIESSCCDLITLFLLSMHNTHTHTEGKVMKINLNVLLVQSNYVHTLGYYDRICNLCILQAQQSRNDKLKQCCNIITLSYNILRSPIGMGQDQSAYTKPRNTQHRKSTSLCVLRVVTKHVLVVVPVGWLLFDRPPFVDGQTISNLCRSRRSMAMFYGNPMR